MDRVHNAVPLDWSHANLVTDDRGFFTSRRQPSLAMDVRLRKGHEMHYFVLLLLTLALSFCRAAGAGTTAINVTRIQEMQFLDALRHRHRLQTVEASYQPQLKVPLHCSAETHDEGYPDSLGCAKPGHYINRFASKTEDLNTHATLPYGAAICCTPGAITNIYSWCTTTANQKNCESDAHPSRSSNISERVSFLAGFSGSIEIENNQYAPTGSATCCDAIVQIDDESTSKEHFYYLEPCNCSLVEDVACPYDLVGNHDKILTGFHYESELNIPESPITCCDVCLGQQVDWNSDCQRYDHCGGPKRGVCHSGFCQCINGYSGMDCSIGRRLPLEDVFKSYVWELVVFFLGICVVGFWVFFILIRTRSTIFNRNTMQQQRNGDDDSHYIELLEDSDSDSDTTSECSLQEPTEKRELGEMAEAEVSTSDRGRSNTALSQGSGCAICMSSSKLVVLVPCGHTNICKRCSKRVDNCPFCRCQILRRQKVYVPLTSEPFCPSLN